MISRRPLVLVVIGALAVPCIGAQAAARPKVKPVCNLVVDDKGDPYGVRQAPDATVPDDALDVLSADVATNAKTMTVVLRLAKLSTPPTTSPAGATYQMTFNVGSDPKIYYVSVSTDPSGASYSEFGSRESLPAVTSIATVLGTPTAVIDLAKSQVRASFPLSLFGSGVTLKKGVTKVLPVETTSGRGTRGKGVFADDAVGGRSYVLGAASCVAVGK